MKNIYINHRGQTLPVKVSDVDYDRLKKFIWWGHYSVHSDHIYAARLERQPDGTRKKIYMHRFITDCPSDLLVDHINRDTLDNRRSNLRICTGSFNAVNRNTTNMSGFRGVYPSGLHSFRARIGVRDDSGKQHMKHLGTFNNKIEAAQAFDRAARQMYGDFAYVNFPEDESKFDIKEEDIPW